MSQSLPSSIRRTYFLKNSEWISGKAHLASVINSGQKTKEEALEELKAPLYPSEEVRQKEIDYILKKFDLTKEEFDKIMSEPPKSHL